MKRKILQSFANRIITRLEKAKDDDEMFQFYLDMGYWFDGICVNVLDIYLD